MKLRNYEYNTPQYKLYCEMHEKVDLEYTKRLKKKYSILNNKKMTIKEALNKNG